jgi:hypothetical protein
MQRSEPALLGRCQEPSGRGKQCVKAAGVSKSDRSTYQRAGCTVRGDDAGHQKSCSLPGRIHWGEFHPPYRVAFSHSESISVFVVAQCHEAIRALAQTKSLNFVRFTRWVIPGCFTVTST